MALMKVAIKNENSNELLANLKAYQDYLIDKSKGALYFVSNEILGEYLESNGLTLVEKDIQMKNLSHMNIISSISKLLSSSEEYLCNCKLLEYIKLDDKYFNIGNADFILDSFIKRSKADEYLKNSSAMG